MNGTVSKLAEKARNGDTEAFSMLIESHERFVFNIAYRMLGNLEDAKDISQEVFIKAFKNFIYYDERASFATWIYRIAVNTCIDYIRKKKKENNVSFDVFPEGEKVAPSNLEEEFISKEGTEEILKAVMALDEDFKAVIVLHDMEGMEYKEISDILGCPIGTVKSRLSRARLKLRLVMKNKKGGAER